MSRTLRSTSPACAARSSTSLCSVTDSGSFGGFVTTSAPRSSSRWRTATIFDAPAISGSSPFEVRTGSSGSPSVPHTAEGRSSFPTRSHTDAARAPVPSPRSAAILGRMSSTEYVPAMRSENVDSTSYGEARLPYTSRLAKCFARLRTGLKATAITAAASTLKSWLCVEPIAVPTPTTTAKYTPVKNAASKPYTTVLLITTSIS